MEENGNRLFPLCAVRAFTRAHKRYPIINLIINQLVLKILNMTSYVIKLSREYKACFTVCAGVCEWGGWRGNLHRWRWLAIGSATRIISQYFVQREIVHNKIYVYAFSFIAIHPKFLSYE